MKKNLLLLLLLLPALCPSYAQVQVRQDSVPVRLTQQYYQTSSFLSHNYDYEQMLRKRQLQANAKTVKILGYTSMGGILLCAELLPAIAGWPLWTIAIDIPVGIGVAGGVGMGFMKWDEKLQARADAIPDLTAQVQLSADALFRTMDSLVSLTRSRYGASSPQLADVELWCAMQCADFGDNQQALALRQQAVSIFRQQGSGPFSGCDSVQQIFLSDLNSKLDYHAGLDYRALREKKRATALKRSYFGPSSEVYLQSLLDLSQLYSERLRRQRSFHYHKLASAPYIQKIKTEFCNSSESERSMYWAQASKYIDRTVTVGRANSHAHVRRNGYISESVYDALLLRKGILLNATRAFEQFVLQSGNQEAIQHLEQRRQLYAEGAEQSVLDTLDHQVLRDLRARGQQYDIPQLLLTWHDVQQGLNRGDLAVEFYRTQEGDYGAVLLRKGWKAPRSIALPSLVRLDKQQVPVDTLLAHSHLNFDTLTEANCQRLWLLSQAVWSNEILKYFPRPGRGRVFFSPDGYQQVAAIESLPILNPVRKSKAPSPQGDYHALSDLYPLYRLSSTRQLALHADSLGRGIAVYGGLDYGMSPELMEQDTHAHGGRRGGSPSVRGAMGMGWNNLPATATEAVAITELINQSGRDSLRAVSYTGEQGTESSFKALSDQDERLIHVATHGFYDSQSYSADPLEASGLCFSGANNRYDVDAASEDGILTAKEAASMNLQGLSLLTLSACETGLGSIGSDGVFGLQRGFKMAGAQSMLMSLWKVDDAATCRLMTEFYHNWITLGLSKHDALERARQTIRQTPGWQDPRFWAAFILLDAAD